MDMNPDVKDRGVLRTKNNFVHHFSLEEADYIDFSRKIVQIENKLTRKFGSTYNLHVHKFRSPQRNIMAVLKSPFKYKKFHDHFVLTKYRFKVTISYTFELTDHLLNAYIYGQLMNVLRNFNIFESGYRITRCANPHLDTFSNLLAIDLMRHRLATERAEYIDKRMDQRAANITAYKRGLELYKRFGKVDYSLYNRAVLGETVARTFDEAMPEHVTLPAPVGEDNATTIRVPRSVAFDSIPATAPISPEDFLETRDATADSLEPIVPHDIVVGTKEEIRESAQDLYSREYIRKRQSLLQKHQDRLYRSLYLAKSTGLTASVPKTEVSVEEEVQSTQA